MFYVQNLVLVGELSRKSGAAGTHARSCCCCVKLEVYNWATFGAWSLFSAVPPESAGLSVQLTEAVQPSSSVAFYLLLL